MTWIKNLIVDWLHLIQFAFEKLIGQEKLLDFSFAQPMERTELSDLNAFMDLQHFEEASGGDMRCFISFNDPMLPKYFRTWVQGTVDEFLNGNSLAQKQIPAFVMFNIVEKREGKVVSSGNGFHRDVFGSQYKIFCYLSDVADGNGPLEIRPKTNSLWWQFVDLLLATFLLRTPKRATISARFSKKRVVTGEVGTAFVANTSAAHRGIPIQEGSRRAFTIYCYRANFLTPVRFKSMCEKFRVKKCMTA